MQPIRIIKNNLAQKVEFSVFEKTMSKSPFIQKSKKGKSAMKKLKEILPALEDKAPFTIPEMYISIKS